MTQQIYPIIHPAHFDSYVRGRDRPGITNECNLPYNTLNVGVNGECFLCLCESWLPINTGDILDFDSLEEVWNSDIAKWIQQDVSDKKFTNCAVESCGIIFPGQSRHKDYYHVTLDLDESCNLACPSCRTEIININQGPKFEKKSQRVQHVLNLLRKFDKPLKIVMIGSGDPLSSLIMRPIVIGWEPRDNQEVVLFTNGLLMKKLLPGTKILPHVSAFWISIDAGSKEVYEDVRRPGKFEVLKDNLDWLHKNKPEHASVILKFTLSAGNARDIENFVDLCYHYGYNGEITKLVDRFTYDRFSDQDVVENLDHPLREHAIKGLQYADKKSKIMIAPNLKSFYATR